MVVRKSKKEEAERRRREQQRIFVEGLQRYKSKGIQILIDGRECRPEEYRKLCEFREDGSFYMADYVGAETGVLTEIHFDRVYNLSLIHISEPTRRVVVGSVRCV